MRRPRTIAVLAAAVFALAACGDDGASVRNLDGEGQDTGSVSGTHTGSVSGTGTGSATHTGTGSGSTP